MKMRRAHVVPLSRQAMQILDGLATDTTLENRYRLVFSEPLDALGAPGESERCEGGTELASCDAVNTLPGGAIQSEHEAAPRVPMNILPLQV
jgi:hypothetical protein